jgi:pimeloyl-ACP methyl ester carboxylesterase
MTVEWDVQLKGGRVVRGYDSGPAGASGRRTIVWHHGSPQTGVLLKPLLSAAADRGVRLVSYARPSYGGSSPLPGRDVASAANDVAQLADALGVDRFAVMGASGGGPHALACAALLPERVTGVVCLAGIAPFTEDFDWYAGMVSDGGLRSAAKGRQARADFAAIDEFNHESFIPADWAALAGDWQSLGDDAMLAGTAGPDGLIDDDVAFASVWGFDLAAVTAPVLLVQGALDRVVPPAHADWLSRRLRRSELWIRPDDGHVSVLGACPAAMDWLLAQDVEPVP